MKIKFCKGNVLEATDIQSGIKLVDIIEKLNVNKHLFCVKKDKIWNIFLFLQ